MFLLTALRVAFIAIFLSLFFFVLYLEAHYGDSDPWGGCAYDPGPFCERERHLRFLREPLNSLSDFSFLALGFYLVYQYLVDSFALSTSLSHPSHLSPVPTNLIRRFPSLTLMYGLANILHAVGTFTNHASRCHLGHRLDLTGMWAASFFSSLFSAFKLLNLYAPSLFNTQATPGNDSLPTFFYPLYLMTSWGHWLLSDVHYPHSYEGIEPRLVFLNVGLVAASELPYFLYTRRWNAKHSPSPSDRWVVRPDVIACGVVCIALGAVLGHLDAYKYVCDPDSWVQLHAIWHVLACACLFSMYLFYRWERPPSSAALPKQSKAR